MIIGQESIEGYSTPLGTLLIGNSRNLLASQRASHLRGKVQLVFTSPPFVLNRKKKYGNLNGQEYVDWIASYAGVLRDLLTDNGSIVIELGNAWEPGQPTMSTLALEALLAFKKEGQFHLCQEFVCFNPARLPTPAQWVNIERCRVKDSFTRVWWLSATPTPKADNRNILAEYSDSMNKLLKKGTYNSGHRPSEHHIGERSFLTNNGGSIPPNVLIPTIEDLLESTLYEHTRTSNLLPIANTQAFDDYQQYCRENEVTPHPARMPKRLAEFFIKFLTEEGDLVVDPFAGSNTTGSVAEALKRKWFGVEMNSDYAVASRARFSETTTLESL